jgi:hypothetical protein
MDERALGVEIRAGTSVWTCTGPDRSGACPRARPGEPVPCAGAQLHLSSAPDDLWVFTAPPGGRTCPLRWLTARAPTGSGEGAFAAPTPSLFD